MRMADCERLPMRGSLLSLASVVARERRAQTAALLALLVLYLASGDGLVARVRGAQSDQPNGKTINLPHWHRPGCYQVGHTRTISIPGCVKFNLSTNACRGFCMSFSIPAAEDIGPTLDGFIEPSVGLAAGPLGNSLTADERLALKMKRRVLGAQVSLPPDQSLASGGQRQPQEFLHLSGQTRSPLAGAVGDTSDKRDVISVGQCCNMMETEDVTVNLRCGFNETRRLVFKSAKTCECFFCKHV